MLFRLKERSIRGETLLSEQIIDFVGAFVKSVHLLYFAYDLPDELSTERICIPINIVTILNRAMRSKSITLQAAAEKMLAETSNRSEKDDVLECHGSFDTPQYIRCCLRMP